MTPKMLLLPILLPAVLAVVFLVLPRTLRLVRDALALAGAAVLLYYGFVFFSLKDLRFNVPWLGMGIDFDLRLYHFSSFILLALAGFLILITLYSTVKMKDAPRAREFFAYVFLTAAFANGAVLANNFVPLVFFWEGLLVTLYGLITIGGRPLSGRTAVKALLISGFCDFSMILGIGLLWTVSGTLTMSEVSVEPTGLAAVAFVLMMIGAAGKAGAMPFHTWIPDAAVDAPVTFMAFLPAAFEKLLGIYLLARISLDFFKIRAGERPLRPAHDRRGGDHRPGRPDGPRPEGLQAAPFLSRRQPGRLHDPRHRDGRAVRHRRRALPHDQPRHVQVGALPCRRPRPGSTNTSGSAGTRCGRTTRSGCPCSTRRLPRPPIPSSSGVG